MRIATGETVVGRRGVLPLLQKNAVDILTIDTQWTGGLTEARKVNDIIRVISGGSSTAVNNIQSFSIAMSVAMAM